MKKTLIFIFFLALFLRLYKLPSIPLGFHADEVRVGWNAWSILKTGFDDRGNKLALYYDTFGDYRPTAIFYATIPTLLLFGKTILAVRLPSALLGAATVFPLYLLTQEILNTRQKKKDKDNIFHKLALLASFFLAISPWHISVSRATSEVAISAFFALYGLYYLVKALSLGNRKNDLVKSAIFIFISYLFYHSIRLLMPGFVLVVVVYYWKEIKLSTRKLAALFLVGVTLLTVVFAINPQSRGRFSQVSIFTDLDVQHELHRMPFEEGPGKVFIARVFHNKLSAYVRRFINEYANYFSGNFLVGKENRPGRYTTTGVGVLTYIELALFIVGLVALAQKKYSLLPFLLLLVAPLAASLTTEDAPNLHRAFYMVFPIMIIQACGLLSLSKKIRKPVVCLLLLNFIFFSHMYFVHAQYKIQKGRNFGAMELGLYLNDNASKYDEVILTNIPDDPYPWIAFFGVYDPQDFNAAAVTRKDGVWKYKNMIFTGRRCPSQDSFSDPQGKVLVVDASACATENKLNDRSDVKIIHEIRNTDEAAGEVYTFWSNLF